MLLQFVQTDPFLPRTLHVIDEDDFLGAENQPVVQRQQRILVGVLKIGQSPDPGTHADRNRQLQIVKNAFEQTVQCHLQVAKPRLVLASVIRNQEHDAILVYECASKRKGIHQLFRDVQHGVQHQVQITGMPQGA
ncbi:Uncharacterised protein [Actinobacillus pleuropneumoniae]|nr:Uncharacterised protein [Actinobacillus pleuropneumoniae]